MAVKFAAGAAVQTPFGKGIVGEMRNNGPLLVDVQGRALELKERQSLALDPVRHRARPPRPAPDPDAALERGSDALRPPRRSRSTPEEIDLHGLTVKESLARAELALNDALLADLPEVRLIHGRSGGVSAPHCTGACARFRASAGSGWIPGTRVSPSSVCDPALAAHGWQGFRL